MYDKNFFSPAIGNIEITISFSVISMNLSNLLALKYVITTYVTHQKMFHFACILNSDALYDKYAEKINILL